MRAQTQSKQYEAHKLTKMLVGQRHQWLHVRQTAQNFISSSIKNLFALLFISAFDSGLIEPAENARASPAPIESVEMGVRRSHDSPRS
jgi:hypothetical protein